MVLATLAVTKVARSAERNNPFHPKEEKFRPSRDGTLYSDYFIRIIEPEVAAVLTVQGFCNPFQIIFTKIVARQFIGQILPRCLQIFSQIRDRLISPLQ